jgi:hypothetical protein
MAAATTDKTTGQRPVVLNLKTPPPHPLRIHDRWLFPFAICRTDVDFYEEAGGMMKLRPATILPVGTADGCACYGDDEWDKCRCSRRIDRLNADRNSETRTGSN